MYKRKPPAERDGRWPDNHLFPHQTVELAVKLNPKRFMPIHWGAYPLALHAWNSGITKYSDGAEIGVKSFDAVNWASF